MIEKWRKVNGYAGIYEVSNFGRVKSLDRVVFNKGNGANANKRGKVLKPNKDRGGYLYVGLYDSNNKKTSSVKIHRLVAFAFCIGYEDGLEVNHKDGVRNNNNSNNLEWCTRSENIRDTFKRGRNTNGEKNNASKLKNKDIGVIVSLYDSGVSQSIIGKAFGVSQSSVSNVIKNKTYKSGLIEKGLAEPIKNK